MKKNIFKFSIGFVIILFISGCYPEGFETYEETDIVLTSYNMQYDFAGISTFYIADTINHVAIGEDEPDRSWDSFILGQLEEGFSSLGYVKVDNFDPSDLPDVVVSVSVLEVENTYLYSYGYPYYPYYGYGWGYPYYPYYGTVSYSTGTIYWNLWDPRNVDPIEETIPVEYGAIVNGLMGSSLTTSQNRISNAIKKAFIQSPYL